MSNKTELRHNIKLRITANITGIRTALKPDVSQSAPRVRC